MNQFLKRATEIQEEIVKNRRCLHQMAEVGMELPNTVAYVKKCLDEMNVSWKDCGCEIPSKVTNDFMAAGLPRMERVTGIVATIGQGEPCILLRADMDALPIVEENDLSFKSESRFSHMCGHDSHTAMLLGAARLLKEKESELKGTVKLMFQPGEETGAGARFMVESGALEDPKVDAGFALHVQSNDEVGKVGYPVGIASASLDTYFVKIQGKGGHSSQPQLCVDAGFIMNQLYQAMNLLVGRECDPAAKVTLSCGVAKAGTVVNIIPDTSELHIGFRTLDIPSAKHLNKRIPELIDHYVKAWGGTYELVHFSTPSTYCDEKFTKDVLPFVEEIAGTEMVTQVPAFTGTEDFGYVSSQVPSMFMFLGAGHPEHAPLHNPRMILDESVFCKGAAIYANVAASWLNKQK